MKSLSKSLLVLLSVLAVTVCAGDWARPDGASSGQGWFKVGRVQYVPATGISDGKVNLYLDEDYASTRFEYVFAYATEDIEQSKTIMALLLTAKNEDMELALYIPSLSGSGVMTDPSYAFTVLEARK